MSNALTNAAIWLFLGLLGILALIFVVEALRSIRDHLRPEEELDFELTVSPPLTRIRLKNKQSLGTLRRRHYRRAVLEPRGHWNNTLHWKSEE